MSNNFSPNSYAGRQLPVYTPIETAAMRETQTLAGEELARRSARFGSTGDNDPANSTPSSDFGVLDPVARSNKYYFKMRFYDYKKPVATYGQNVVKNIGQLTKEIRLPLPLGLLDKTDVAYDIAALQLLGDINFEPAGQATDGRDLLKALGEEALQALPSAVNRIALNNLADEANSLANRVSGGNAGDVSALIQQSFGATVNPNEALTLTGPGLRTWNFRWVFLPHTREESEGIQKLIQELKARSLPFIAKSRMNNGQASGLLGYPQICMINTYPWDDPSADGGTGTTIFGWTSSSIMKIKRTMLSSVNVNYNSQGTPAFFRGTNNPVSIELGLTFKEVEYFLAEDEAQYTTYDIPFKETPTSNIVDKAVEIGERRGRQVLDPGYNPVPDPRFGAI